MDGSDSSYKEGEDYNTYRARWREYIDGMQNAEVYGHKQLAVYMGGDSFNNLRQSTDYEENCNYKLNWKVGGGFEFRVCKLIGIEPSVMLNSKGTKWEWEGKTVKFSRTANLLYLETPIMCNFHIDEKWAFGAGVYFATLVDDGGTDLCAYDSGLCFGGKYQFGNGYFLGLDSTLGRTDLGLERWNFTMGAIFGYRF